MILWLDDVRTPDDDLGEDLVWARNYDEAIEALGAHEFSAAYLDHDLMPEEPTGYDVVAWMVAHDRVPPKVVIHSHNPVGADAMADLVRDWAVRNHHHVGIRVRPYAADACPELVDDYIEGLEEWTPEEWDSE